MARQRHTHFARCVFQMFTCQLRDSTLHQSAFCYLQNEFHTINNTVSTSMVSFTSAHRWNSLLCPPLGFLFNFSLLWLILRRTPKEMRVHSRILLQTFVMDTLLLALQCIGQIAMCVDRRHTCFIQFYEGFFVRQFKTHFSPLLLAYLCSVWVFLHNLSISGTAVQFIYRYLVLNRNIKITVCKYFLLLSGISLGIFVMTILILLGSIEGLNQQPIDKQLFGAFVDFEEQKAALNFTTEIDQSILLNGVGGYALLNALSYSTICFCGWKMVRFVSKNVTLTGRLKELNRQLTKCLIILASIPLIIVIVSFAITYDIFFCRTIPDSADWTMEWELYLMLTLHWLPVLNPLVTIYVNRPYRDALLGRFMKIAPLPIG